MEDYMKSLPHIVIPHFRQYRINISVSNEAHQGLGRIADALDIVGPRKNTPKLIVLMEAIGLYQLSVDKPTDIVDEDTNITTRQCREDGYNDALEGRPPDSTYIYGAITRPYYEAYMRGFFEGKYVRRQP